MMFHILLYVSFFVTISFGDMLRQFTTTVVPTKITSESNKDFLPDLELKVFKNQDGQMLVNLTCTLLKTFPEDLIVKIGIFVLQNGDYVQYGTTLEHGICDFVDNDRLFYPGILKKSNLVSKCPVPPGKYYLANYQVPLDTLPPGLPEVEGKADIQLVNDDGVMVHIVAYGGIEKNQEM